MGNSSTGRSRLGSKRKMPNGRWEVRVGNGYRADGRQRVVTERVDTEEEADRRIREIAEELGRRPDLARGIALGALWDAYRADKGERLTRKTMYDYDWLMGRFWLPAMGDRDISRIGRAEVQAVLLTIPRTYAKRALGVLSSALTYAVSRGALVDNPLRGASFEMPGDTGSAWDDPEAFEDDPFAAIEGGRDVWDARTVMRALPLMRGLRLEPAWLAMVGGGLRLEEAMALRRADVRRVEVGGRMVTQAAVHHARTELDGVKRTKTRHSVRIVAVMEPFGERLWEVASAVGDRKALLCDVSTSRQNKLWRSYFDEPPTSKHAPRCKVVRGSLLGLPYVPLSRMRATHATLMQEAGILDSVNAAVHGNTEKVLYANYQRPDLTDAAAKTSDYLRLVG